MGHHPVAGLEPRQYLGRQPGTLAAVKLTGSLKAPDGLRPGPNGVLYVAENADGQVDLLRFSSPTAAVVEPES